MAAPNKSGIYKIVNDVNGKIYIGCSISISRRWKEHRYDLNHDLHVNIHLQNAWKKYGKDNFSFVILELTNDDLYTKEKHYNGLKNTNK